MSLRSLPAVVLAVLLAITLVALAGPGCGASKKSDEPTTAKEKQRRDARAAGEEVDPGVGKKWGGWRFKGDRDDCFFIVGAKCFKTEKAACKAAKCKQPKACTVTGAAPAQVTCA